MLLRVYLGYVLYVGMHLVLAVHEGDLFFMSTNPSSKFCEVLCG